MKPMMTRATRRLVPLCALFLAALAKPGAAQTPPEAEVFDLDRSRIIVYPHEFLDDSELAILRSVGQDRNVLAFFMGSQAGHGAIAVAPDQGFIRDGMPAPGATALAQLPDPATARHAALDLCAAERDNDAPCVVVLEVIPLD